MLVGFMDRPKKPRPIATVTALMSAHFGVELIYFRPWDIDIKNKLVNGKIYKNNKWVSVTRELPLLIDTTVRCFRRDAKEIMDDLRENSILTFDKKNTPDKEALQKELLNDIRFAHLVIPTKSLESFESLKSFLTEYSSIIMKPLSGRQGRGLYSLRKQNKDYILGYQQGEKVLNHNELFEFYNEFLMDKKYIVQKLIESRTKNNDPFDCRIVVQKDGKGHWVAGKLLIRIGIGQKVVSNTSQGGSISESKSFLKTNFNDQWEDIYHRLKEIAVTLPYKIEEIKQTPTMDLGLDLGIEKNGDLFLFESNNGASLDCLISESAMLRLEYYHYLYNTHPALKHIGEKNDKDSKIKIVKKKQESYGKDKSLLEERNYYKKKWIEIKNSKSWRITSPIRKIGSLFKRY